MNLETRFSEMKHIVPTYSIYVVSTIFRYNKLYNIKLLWLT